MQGYPRMSRHKETRTPGSPFLLLSVLGTGEEIESAFGDIERRWRERTAPASDWPPVDLYERPDSYVLLADLPGVSPEDVELRLEGRELVLCGLRWRIGFVRVDRGVVLERRCGRFCRSFLLDRQVDLRAAERGYENGIYWVRLPVQADAWDADPEA